MSGFFRIVLLAVLILSAADVNAELPVEPQTGFFRLSFSPEELLGEDGAEKSDYILRSDDELSWQLYVPPNYDPERPAGVMVYVSPTKRGGPPRVWNGLLKQNNMIWIGANDSGNRVAVGKRMFLAMLAPRIAASYYSVDTERIYVSGFSGGGKTAGLIMAANPDMFRGGIYIGGAEIWGSSQPPPRLGVIRENHHVFLTGTEDFNERLTRRVYAAFKNAGVENCELIVERRRGHQLPSPGVMSRAIEFLDSRLAAQSDPDPTIELANPAHEFRWQRTRRCQLRAAQR